MNRTGCTLVMTKNGKPSKLYQKILEKTNSRIQGNLIYASYLQEGVADAMDALYSRDSSGEHRMEDVWKFLNVPAWINDIESSSASVAKNYGAYDDLGNPKDFTDGSVAYNLANRINTERKDLVAYVILVGNAYNVRVEGRNSRTIYKAERIERELTVWDNLKEFFNVRGIKINDFNKVLNTTVSPLNVSSFVGYVNTMSYIPVEAYRVNDLNTAILLHKDNSVIQNLISRAGGGDIVATAEALYDYIQNAPAPNSFYDNALRILTTRYDDIAALNTVIPDAKQEYNDSETAINRITKILTELHNNYNINTRDYEVSQRINTITDAVTNMIMVLNKLVRYLLDTKGNTAGKLKLEATLQKTLEELDNNNCYLGLVTILDNAKKYAKEVYDSLTARVKDDSYPTPMDKIYAITEYIQKVRTLKLNYFDVVSALANWNLVAIDISITEENKETLINLSKEVLQIMQEQESNFNNIQEETIITLLRQILGETTSSGLAISSLVKSMAAKESIFNIFYSMDRASNDYVAAVGSIIRTAQSNRDKPMNEVSLKIRQITNALQKSSGNLLNPDTSFMYTPEGYIISDIDWVKFETALRKQRKKLKDAGFEGVEFDVKLNEWLEKNTEDRQVSSQRTERVPNSKYRLAENPYDLLTDALKTYYDKMMELKGDLEDILPAYALHHYLAPQIRKDWLDVLTDSKQTDKVRNLWDRMNFLKIRENDPEMWRTEELNGEEVSLTRGDFYGERQRDIPVFYVRKLKNPQDLLHDFSSGMQAFASTAINYGALSLVRSTVEFMRDFLEEKVSVAAEVSRGKNGADKVSNRDINIWLKLADKTKKLGIVKQIDGYIDSQMFGETFAEGLNKQASPWYRFAKTLMYPVSLHYLSFNLAGAINNVAVANLQMLIEASGGEFYNMGDLMKAIAWLGPKEDINAGSRFVDLITNNVNSKAWLLAEKFDPMQDNFYEKGKIRYHTNFARCFLGNFDPLLMYSKGEYMVHFVNMYAVLNHQKVKLENGKIISLFDALEKEEILDENGESTGTYRLAIPENAKVVEKVKGNWQEIADLDEAYLDQVKGFVRQVNQQTHGSMNSEDKGLIHRYLAGRWIMQLRLWMVESLSRRWRTRHFEGATKDYREGYYVTSLKFFRDLTKDLFNFQLNVASRWNNLDKSQLANIRKTFAEVALIGILVALDGFYGDPDKSRKKWWYRMFQYQVKRAELELFSMSPIGLGGSFFTVLNSPSAGINAVQMWSYFLTGFLKGDYKKKLERGRGRGQNKYWYYTKKYYIPGYKDWEKYTYWDEDDNALKAFQSIFEY